MMNENKQKQTNFKIFDPKNSKSLHNNIIVFRLNHIFSHLFLEIQMVYHFIKSPYERSLSVWFKIFYRIINNR
jgi:hypothetical protein